jgi:hypothetical protein
MLLFVLWSTLVIGGLACAGYSHYRYRVTHNRYYERLFAVNRNASDDAEAVGGVRLSYAVPVFTLVIIVLLVPISIVI